MIMAAFLLKLMNQSCCIYVGFVPPPSHEFTRAQSKGVVLCLRPNEGLPAAASCSATRWGLQCEYCTSRDALQKVINGAGFHPQPVMFGPATTFIQFRLFALA